MAYLSNGIMVLGNKPMFHDVDVEVLGTAIKQKVLNTFGCYPVLDISEHWEIFDPEYHEEPEVLRDYRLLLDTELLDRISGFNLNYVDGLLERVIVERSKDPSTKHLDTYASKKYCFSDTEDWWDAARLDTIPSEREIFTLIVDLS